MFIDDELGVTTTISRDPIFSDVFGFQFTTDFVTDVMYKHMIKVIGDSMFYETFEDAEPLDVAIVLWHFSKALPEIESGATCASTFVFAFLVLKKDLNILYATSNPTTGKMTSLSSQTCAVRVGR